MLCCRFPKSLNFSFYQFNSKLRPGIFKNFLAIQMYVHQSKFIAIIEKCEQFFTFRLPAIEYVKHILRQIFLNNRLERSVEAESRYSQHQLLSVSRIQPCRDNNRCQVNSMMEFHSSWTSRLNWRVLWRIWRFPSTFETKRLTASLRKLFIGCETFPTTLQENMTELRVIKMIYMSLQNTEKSLNF